jgi:hypothetical protein
MDELTDPEDRGDKFIRNVGGLLPNYMALQPKISNSLMSESQIQPHYCTSLKTSLRVRHTLEYVTQRRGRTTAQVVSRRLPTAAFRVLSQVKKCGICGGQIGIGAGFLRILPFPLPIFIPPTAPHSSIIRAGTTGQLVADVPSAPTPWCIIKSSEC